MSGILAIIFLVFIVTFAIATMWYSSGEAAFFLTLGIVAIVFFWDLTHNGGKFLATPIIMIGNWLGIRLWTALFIFLTTLGGYVFGNWGKAIAILVLVLIILYSLGLLGPLTSGDLSALKEAVQIGIK
ncbi:hypothetical protein [Pyrococcus kukulkanii]|uniref:Uncharacterized protein n=1 Tax=Pyrococcus kukulkanii TaxID=1609559 RepID=A0ABV4T8V2_9EURY